MKTATIKGDELPIVQNGYVTKIWYTSCGGSLRIELIAPVRGVEFEEWEHGYAKNCWYALICDGLPDRHFRALYGRESLSRLIFNHGVMDAKACVNRNEGKVEYETTRPTAKEKLPMYPYGDTYVRERVIGVRQRTLKSGVCWFGSVCFSLLFHKTVREYMLEKAGTVDPKLPALMERALECTPESLRTKSCEEPSEKLRKYLWERFKFGDDYEKSIRNPEDDGQNGMTQLLILLSALRVPVVVYRYCNDHLKQCTEDCTDNERSPIRFPTANDDEPQFLVVRYYSKDHARDKHHRPLRCFTHGNRKYYLVSMFLGSHHCGHQIAGASRDLSQCHWATSCVDARYFGIGPFHWSTSFASTGFRQWWEYWRKMIPLIRMSNGDMCNLSPNQPHDNQLINLDLFYYSKGA